MKSPAAVDSFSNTVRNEGSTGMNMSKYLPIELNDTGIESFPFWVHNGHFLKSTLFSHFWNILKY